MLQKYTNSFYFNRLEINIFNLLVSLLIAPIFAGLMPKLLDFGQSYNEFTVGTITFLGVSKNIDYLIIIGFIFGFVLTYLLINKITHCVSNMEYQRFKEQSIIVSIPAIIWFGGLIFSKEINITLLIVSSELLLYLVVSYAFNINNKEFITHSLLATFFTIFSIFAWSMFANRVFDVDVAWLLKLTNPYLSVQLVVAVGVFLSVYSLIFFRLPNFKNKLMVLTQLSLPLLFLYLIPQKVLSGNELIFVYPVTNFLYNAVVFLILVSLFLISKKIFLSNISLTQSLSSISFIAILFFMKTHLIVIPSVSGDDYHFGEFLLPFWSLAEYGQIPFQDIVPARGLINYLDGFLVSIFFELKASYFSYVETFLSLFYTIILFYGIKKYYGMLYAFLLVLISPPWLGVSGIDIFNAVVLVVLVHLFIDKKYHSFLAFSLLLVTVSILFAPGQGGILALSITPLGLYALYKIFSIDYKTSLRYLAFLLIPYLLIIMPTSLFDMLYGAILYAKEQSSLNGITYGTPWYFSVNSFTNGNHWLFEIVRSGYVFIIGFSFIVLVKYIANKELANRKEVLVYASIIFITALLFIVRGAGRIDPGWFSRLGIATVYIVGTLLPLLIYHLSPRYKSMLVMIFVVFYISIFGYIGNSLSLNQLIAKVDSKTHLPTNFKYSQDIGIYNMGNGVFEDSHIERVVKIKNFLETVLEKNETFLNLTNRNALYFYLERKPPIETGAFYNLVSEGQQKRAISKLSKDIPKIAILEADNILHDKVKLPLRTPLLYRFVMQNYQPIEIEGVVYGIRNDIFNKFINKISKHEQQKLYEKVFLTSHLEFIPSEWGRNFDRLSKKLNLVQELSRINGVNDLKKIEFGYTISGNDPFVAFGVDDNIYGNEAGYLSFDFDCMDKSKGTNHFEIYFKGDKLDFSEHMMLKFDSKDGKNLIPLESHPRYLQFKHLDSIRIDIVSNSSCKTFNISNVELYQKRYAEELNLDKKIELLGVKEYTLSPYPLSDKNWTNGVSKDNTTFFISNEDYQYFNLKVGDIVDINTLGKIKIIKTKPFGQYMHIIFIKI